MGYETHDAPANQSQGAADVDREQTARSADAQPHATLCGPERKSCLKRRI